MFNFFKKKEELKNNIVVNDDAIVAIADGQLIDVTTVPDPVFAEKMMGDPSDNLTFMTNRDN